ncbi:hypothetical protein OPV22_032257 [Ensete ventricosum]|uniref:Uncharacterized protein n=1 Tax=Ensete ventricosum TaxID=4639 RepID=A0AAV8PM77_ENSVE|nr:hypothetical protein OPV22_032257 [Ensete ventricosum]
MGSMTRNLHLLAVMPSAKQGKWRKKDREVVFRHSSLTESNKLLGRSSTGVADMQTHPEKEKKKGLRNSGDLIGILSANGRTRSSAWDELEMVDIGLG